VSLSLAALADLAEAQGRSTVELFSPRARFRSVSHSDLDACLARLTELTMTVDIDDADDVVVGSRQSLLVVTTVGQRFRGPPFLRCRACRSGACA
jgi:hypothetical protein